MFDCVEILNVAIEQLGPDLQLPEKTLSAVARICEISINVHAPAQVLCIYQLPVSARRLATSVTEWNESVLCSNPFTQTLFEMTPTATHSERQSAVHNSSLDVAKARWKTICPHDTACELCT